MELNIVKVLVTGGTGFIGSHVVEKLIGAGYDVCALAQSRNTDLEKSSKIFSKAGFLKSNILEAKKITQDVKGFDCIVHLAALRSTKESIERPLDYNHVNIDGTVNILEAARKNGIRKIIFASSSSVYGNSADLPQKEESVAEPSNPYGLSKLACEKYCALYGNSYGIETVSLRPFNVYGPREEVGGSVISHFIYSALKGTKPAIYGSGSNRRDFVFVEDVADAFVMAVKNIDGLAGKAINVGSGKNHSVTDVLKLVENVSQKELLLDRKPNFPGNVNETLADITRAKKLLNWQPKHSLEEGLRKTYAWYKSNI